MTAHHFSQLELVQLDDLLALQIRNPHAEALIALQGAQVLSYTRSGDKPLIWLSEQAEFKSGQSVRGGIPVCWPWFGALDRNPLAVRQQFQSDTQAPAHGLVRGVDWQLTKVTESADGCRVYLRYPSPIGLAPNWPVETELTLEVFVGETLELRLSTRNTGAVPLAFSQALHTYFAVSHIDQVRIEGLEHSPYLDTLAEWQEKIDSAPVAVEQEVDRVYLEVPKQVSIRDEAWQRRIFIEAEGSTSAVVWNPWIAKSQRLSQFAPDAYQRMLCIETANVMSDHVVVAPGEHWLLGLTLRTERL